MYLLKGTEYEKNVKINLFYNKYNHNKKVFDI